mgnify:CR=1 FL=1
MCMNVNLYNEKTGYPNDENYLECSLPSFLQESLNQMKLAWKRIDSGEVYLNWDGDYCTLQSDINCAETDGQISPDQAWYLRKKYLRMEFPEVIE